MSPDATSLPTISGATDVYFILGDPVEQVRAPETFNGLFAQNGIDAVLVPIQVPAAHLAGFVQSVFQARNVKGLWVTMPHKEAMLGLVHSCSETARIAGAVNAVRRNAAGQLEGALFDGDGFLASLAYYGITHGGKRVLVIGAGGAAAAIGTSLALGQGAGAARELAFFDPTPGKAAALAARIQAATATPARAVAHSDPTDFDLVVNASPLGLRASDPLPCDMDNLASHCALVDIVMKNQPTPWVQAARARGLQAQPGFEMLIQQSHLYLDFFGFHGAARRLQSDCTPLRRQMYPDALAHEITQPFRPATPTETCPPFQNF